MCKQCSNVCKFRTCLATESTNLARKCTIVTTVLQRQYSQTELIFWITLVFYIIRIQHIICPVPSFVAPEYEQQFDRGHPVV